MTHATHPKATLTPTGRLKLARLVVVQGWTSARAPNDSRSALLPRVAGLIATDGSGPPAWWIGPRDRIAAHIS
jgi:hypothetical protein